MGAIAAVDSNARGDVANSETLDSCARMYLVGSLTALLRLQSQCGFGGF